jgi:rRNA pseudouridine-1189 N-methylase Emg1 (Nep1/Mra1 family)
LFVGAPHGDRLPANSVQKWPLTENPICARVYRVKTTVLVGVTGFPHGDDSEEVFKGALNESSLMKNSEESFNYMLWSHT